MLSLTDDIPVFITEHIQQNFSTATPEEIQVYKADSGWLLRVERTGMSSPFHRFFGEPLPTDRVSSLMVYINKDAEASGPEYGFEVVYGYGHGGDELKNRYCDTEFTKNELISWISDEYRHQATTESLFDGDSAIDTFLNNITWDSYHCTSIIRYMVDSRQYPFNFIKDVIWLN